MINCCICLCVFNNEEGLPFVLNNIKKLDCIFNVKILVFYDHSEDKSYEILVNYNKINKNMEIIVNRFKSIRERINWMNSPRTKRIAFARNSLLQLIKKKYNKYEYFIMMDSNEYSCVGNININVLKESLLLNNWDSLSFDREAGYYDQWALSFDPFIYSFFHFKNWRKGSKMMIDKFKDLLDSYRKKNELMPVYSAYNGFAIYKTNKFLNCSYSSNIDLSLFPQNSIEKQQKLTNDRIIISKKRDCEHRHFHLDAIKKNNALIRISTKSLFSKVDNPRPNLRGPC